MILVRKVCYLSYIQMLISLMCILVYGTTCALCKLLLYSTLTFSFFFKRTLVFLFF